jgi:hypothetical protein
LVGEMHLVCKAEEERHADGSSSFDITWYR